MLPGDQAEVLLYKEISLLDDILETKDDVYQKLDNLREAIFREKPETKLWDEYEILENAVWKAMSKITLWINRHENSRSS